MDNEEYLKLAASNSDEFIRLLRILGMLGSSRFMPIAHTPSTHLVL
tara:strand:- start:2425 stop:2562 length:138 start_codon:yes stop_codon:yes gene_type:complete